MEKITGQITVLGDAVANTKGIRYTYIEIGGRRIKNVQVNSGLTGR